MQTKELNAIKRDVYGKGPSRRLRMEGKLPAVVYGHGIDPLSLTIEERAIDRILRTKLGVNTLIDLNIADGDTHKVLIKEYQGHAINRRVKHVDFLIVDENQEVSVSIPARFTGKAKGLAQGGVMDVKKHEIDLTAQVGKIPEEIVIDVTNLGIGDNIHLSDLTLPEGVSAKEDYNPTIVAMISISAEAIPEPTTAAAEGDEAAAEGEGESAEGEKPAEGSEEKKDS